jgi:hypothetical protein
VSRVGDGRDEVGRDLQSPADDPESLA